MQATNWIEVTKKIVDNSNYSSDDEASEWLANIDPSLSDKLNEEKQLDNSEIPIPFRFTHFCYTFHVTQYLRNSPAQT